MNNRAMSTRWRLGGISISLAALTWLVFGSTLNHGFINFDDGAYVYRNAEVTKGITLPGAKWAFTHAVAANWHPLTVLSHMLDCSLYGTAPAGQDRKSVV